MSRTARIIRDARPGDAEALMRLWSAAGNSSATTRPTEEAGRALAQLAAAADERLLVGEHNGEVVAAMHLRRGQISPVHTEMAVHTSYLIVLPDFRKHGYAHALLETAVAWAEEKDVAHVTAITSSNSRDTNRFLARLGLADIATIRATDTATLRHKLTPEAMRPGQRRNLGRVLAQRRSMRRLEGA